MNKWKYALSSADEAPSTAPILLRGTVQENLMEAARLGYDGIEIHTREDAVLDYQSIRETIKQCGTVISAVVTGRLNTEGKCSLTADEPYIVDAAIRGMKQYIDMAQRLQADIVLGWVKGNVPSGGRREKYLARLARNLQILNDYAKARDVKIFIEVINRYEVNIFTTAEELMSFLGTYPLDNCYAHLDTFHMGVDECDSAAAIRCCGDRLGYFHLADNSRRYPGSGQFNFSKIFQALEDIHYDGYLSVECFPYPNGTQAAERALKYLKKVTEDQTPLCLQG